MHLYDMDCVVTAAWRSSFYGNFNLPQISQTVCWSQLFHWSLIPAEIVVCYAGESTFEMKIEADSNDITEHPHDDKPRPYLCTVCDKRFTAKRSLKRHKHNVDKLYPCTQCEKRFTTQLYLTRHMKVHSSKHKCTEGEK